MLLMYTVSTYKDHISNKVKVKFLFDQMGATQCNMLFLLFFFLGVKIPATKGLNIFLDVVFSLTPLANTSNDAGLV